MLSYLKKIYSTYKNPFCESSPLLSHFHFRYDQSKCFQKNVTENNRNAEQMGFLSEGLYEDSNWRRPSWF